MQKDRYISVIYVHYKKKNDLFRSIRSLKRNYLHKCEIIVVDNDKSVFIKRDLLRKFKDIIYIKSQTNGGFGAGINLGLKYSTSNYVLLLNPDTIIKPRSIEILVTDLKQHPEVAIAAPNVVNRYEKSIKQLGYKILTPVSGIFILSFLSKLFPHNRYIKDYWTIDNKEGSISFVEVVPGCAFLIRRNILEKIGGFDENMFLYFEEFDIGKRLNTEGYKTIIDYKSKIFHKWTKNEKPTKGQYNAFRSSRYYYFKKHYGLLPAIAVELFVRFPRY